MTNTKILRIALVIITVLIVFFAGCKVNDIKENTHPTKITVPMETREVEGDFVLETTGTATEVTIEATEVLKETTVPTTEPVEPEPPATEETKPTEIKPAETKPVDSQPVGTVPPVTEPPVPESEPEHPSTEPPVTTPSTTEPPATEAPATEPEQTECQHNWKMVYHPEEGHYGNYYNICKCGYVFGDPAEWEGHVMSAGGEAVIYHTSWCSTRDYIVDSPEYYEWNCSACGAGTTTQP